MGKTIDATKKASYIGLIEPVHYLVTYGETELNPISTAPQVEGDVETADVNLYETYGDAEMSLLSKNNCKVTITTRAVAVALGMLASFKKGDNIFDSGNKDSLILTPIGDVTAPILTFTDAYLNPGLSTSYGDDGKTPNTVTLVFTCKANDTTGKPFVVGDDDDDDDSSNPGA